ncbi:MAG: FHA domain-containing protein [Gammaproteobacteria bacterium]|nr:FHA domain-containing protein [Gammaproteobacteria bacterium]
MQKIILKNKGLVVEQYPLEKDRITIGRNSDNDIHLDEPVVSGCHAAVVLEDSPYLEDFRDAYIEDMDSTNGTLLNNKTVTRQMLKHGDVISIGQYELSYESDSGQSMERTAILLPEDTMIGKKK